MYFLDTDICIYLIKEKSKQLLEKLERHSLGECVLSSITLSELQYGVAKSQKQQQNALALERFLIPLEVMPFDSQAGIVLGNLRAQLEKKGNIIGIFDMMIAAHALSCDATLVTNNMREFSRVKNLSLENWSK